MEIKLEKAIMSDAPAIFEIQVKTFLPLLNKYKDISTNPANEQIDNVIARINNPNGGFYKIVANNDLVGAICTYWKDKKTDHWISPMFILPEHQGKGIAQVVISLAEEMIPQANTWELATILEEERNCYLYEKMGYVKTGIWKKLNVNATLVFYKKIIK